MAASNDYTQNISVHGQSGGTDGRVVRLNSGNIWQDAEPGDASSELGFLFYKQNGDYFEPGRVIYDLSGLT
ncbi:MAG: hypothetical protein AAF267_25530, partial [Deinococcota bacterium]